MSRVRLGEIFSVRETRTKWDIRTPSIPCPKISPSDAPQHIADAMKKYGYGPRYYWCTEHGDWFSTWKEHTRENRNGELVSTIDLMTCQCPKCIVLKINCIGMPDDEF